MVLGRAAFLLSPGPWNFRVHSETKSLSRFWCISLQIIGTMMRIKTPKSGRIKRELEKRAPRLVSSEISSSYEAFYHAVLIFVWWVNVGSLQVETRKKTLILHGTKTTSVLNSVLTEIHHLKKDNSIKYSRRNDKIRPFESGGETSLEFFSLKTDCSLFVVCSISFFSPTFRLGYRRIWVYFIKLCTKVA